MQSGGLPAANPVQDSPPTTIPVQGETYAISKKMRHQDFVVEKRWATKTVSVPVTVRYEEVYVNGKRFGSGLETALSSLKGTLKKETDEERLKRKKSRLGGEQVPLYHDNGSPVTEERLLLFGEEVVVRKRMQQVGEAVITKRKVTSNRKVSLDIKGERVVVTQPDGTEEQLQGSVAS